MTMRLATLPLLLGFFLAPAAVLAASPDPRPSTGSAAPAAAPAAASHRSGWVKTELYFAAQLANGRPISPEAWSAFLAEVITPAFPNGLTVYEASGQMKEAGGTIRRQPTWVVVILRPTGAEQDRQVQSVLTGYQRRFAGANLMWVDIPVPPPQFFSN